MIKPELVIMDWAGTTIDYGCFGPVRAFVEVFRHFKIEPTMEEVRKPMGMLKRDHIKTMLRMPRIQAMWMEIYQRPSGEADIDDLYQLFEKKLIGSLSQYCDVKPGVIETVEALRKKGIAIGSTTGYTDPMMEIVTREAKRNGYAPDGWYSPDSVGNLGRPYPYMIYRNMEAFQVHSVKQVLKIGDTISDIQEGQNAGVYTVGVVEGSSEMGLSETEYNILSDVEKEKAVKRIRNRFLEAGADAVILNMGDFMKLIS
ncbi:MAG: phosphonoacetaldehyde hydrolase [Lachnospiraceae bacterium]